MERMQERWNEARQWLCERGVTRPMSLLVAHYPELEDEAKTIGNLWNARIRISEQHLPILTKVEAIIESIKNQPNAP